jgi:hypothetical protein
MIFFHPRLNGLDSIFQKIALNSNHRSGNDATSNENLNQGICIMNKIILSLVALTAISGAAFAGNDGSNGQSGRDLAGTVMYSASQVSGTILDQAAVLNSDSNLFSTNVGDREAGAASH